MRLVYRHFPDQQAVFNACSEYSFEENPPPDPETWRTISDPKCRLEKGLYEFYGYYGSRRQLLVNHRDAEMPVVAAALARRSDMLARAAGIIAERWHPQDAKASRLLSAGIRHALDFTTWRSLVEFQELSDGEAVGAMLRFVSEIAGVGSEPT